MIESPITQLLYILFTGWYLGRLVKNKLDLPPMLGELTAGLIIGPPILNLI